MKLQFNKMAVELMIGHQFMSEHRNAWLELQADIEDLPIFYEYSMVCYQNLYFSGAEAIQEFFDLSIILFSESRAVALWPLSVCRLNGELKLGSQESAIKKPLFRKGVPAKVQKKIYDQCLNFLFRLRQLWGLKALHFAERIRGGGVDEWHRKLMEAGASSTITHDMYVDLARDIADIRREYRKSYKSIINRAYDTWRVELLDRHSPKVFDEFMLLHRQVSGRSTRSLESWETQAKMLDENRAFLVTLRSKDDDRLVGAGFFQFTIAESVYASAAYDRSLKDQALGHLIQDVAIQYLKDHAVRWHYIGQRPYPGDARSPSEKELAIGYFKEGFMTDLFLTVHSEIKFCD